MKRFAKAEDDDIVRIPNKAGIRPIAIEPQLGIGIAFDVPDVRIAIEASYMYTASSITPLFEIQNDTEYSQS
jgi:hypothetical protein